MAAFFVPCSFITALPVLTVPVIFSPISWITELHLSVLTIVDSSWHRYSTPLRSSPETALSKPTSEITPFILPSVQSMVSVP